MHKLKYLKFLLKHFWKWFFCRVMGTGDGWVFPQLNKSRSYTFQWMLDFYPQNWVDWKWNNFQVARIFDGGKGISLIAWQEDCLSPFSCNISTANEYSQSLFLLWKKFQHVLCPKVSGQYWQHSQYFTHFLDRDCKKTSCWYGEINVSFWFLAKGVTWPTQKILVIFYSLWCVCYFQCNRS